ncbi:hypothetical protein ACUHMQ_06465 [Chitinimonas sp. PSY-7]|uniref:hypothetical protein n=1 Tax=Chitinimonas sp. PSY-7 TaxID=3459088 RepID=UPI00403FFFDA
MEVEHYPSKQGGELELDICFSCRLIWFDQYESAQLTPAAVVGLFERLHSHHETMGEQVTLNTKLTCVRCADTLLSTQDVVRQNRFTYYRCGGGHGRLISFWHFLREKQFVRDLNPQECQKLAASATQIKCNSCGARVDVRNQNSCNYCRAPFAVLDKEAVSKALLEYRQSAGAGGAAQTADMVIALERMNQAKRRENAKESLIDKIDTTMDVVEMLFWLLR